MDVCINRVKNIPFAFRFGANLFDFNTSSADMSPTVANSRGAKVQLTLLGLFRTHGVAEAGQLAPLVGVQELGWAHGAPQVTLGSVPFHNRAMDRLAPAQGRGMLALFGIRDALEELQHWRTVARNSQAQFAYMQLQVEVGASSSGVLTRQQLRAQGAALRFLHVKRCAAEMQKEWLLRFAQWVQEEGGDASRDMSQVRHMALRPDLFERLLYTDPDLRHIDVMVMPLADRNDVSRSRQVAYLRAGTPLASVTQGSDQMQVQLPAWMAQRASVLP